MDIGEGGLDVAWKQGTWDVEQDLRMRSLRARREVPKGSEQVPKITLLCRRNVQEKVTENFLCNGSEVVDFSMILSYTVAVIFLNSSLVSHFKLICWMLSTHISKRSFVIHFFL